MTDSVGIALVALPALLLLVTLVVAWQRAHRVRAERRRQAVAEPLRAVLMRLAAGEPDDAATAVEELAALDDARWAAVEGTLETLLLKVKGETHASVVTLLERRGSLAHALAGTFAQSLVRRARGAEVLGAAGCAAAVPDLLRLLSDPEPEVRGVAARALGRIGAPEAAAPLLEAVSSARPVPAGLVSTALLRIGPQAHQALEQVMRTGDALQRAVAVEIAGLGRAVRSVDTLIELLRGEVDGEVRIRAARALGRIGSPRAVPELLNAVADEQPLTLRIVGARALGELGAVAAVPRLGQLALSGDHHVGASAAASLTKCGPLGLRTLHDLAALDDGTHARAALAMAALTEPPARPDATTARAA